MEKKKEWQRLDKGSVSNIHQDSLWATLKSKEIRKLQFVMSYMDSGFKNSRPSTTNWPCNLKETKHTWMDDESKNNSDPEGPRKRIHSQRPLTDNVFIYDEKNIT